MVVRKRRAPKSLGGRPRTREQPSVTFTVRCEPEDLAAVDAWAEARELKRSQAAVKLMRRGLRR